MNLVFEIEKLLGRKRLSASVSRDYDRRRGYARHHEACRAALERALPADADPALAVRGFARVAAVQPALASAHLERLEHGSIHIERDGGAELLAIRDRALARELLERVITPEVDRQLLQLFGSEYVPYWLAYNRTRPGSDERRSFLWHCDKGPSAFAKLLVNLTSASRTGGCTDLIDAEQTRAFDRAGYVFRGQSDRRADLRPLAERRRLRFAPERVALEAGEGLLFRPRDVLHRGVPPSRDVWRRLHVTFLPSPVPWREAFERLEAQPPGERHRYAWASSADLLTRSLASDA